MPNVNKNIVIVVAAGKSLRMQGIDKIETIVGGRPLIEHTLKPFLSSKKVSDIIIVCNDENKKRIIGFFPGKKFPKIHFCLGGDTRFTSAKNGFIYTEKNLKPHAKSVILFHNCGNVLATQEEIELSITLAKKTGACIVARPASDTLKKINNDIITETIDRSQILYAETPQTFRYDILKKAYIKAEKEQKIYTDESSLVESFGHSVTWIPASPFNRKITTQHDLQFTKRILEKSHAMQTVYGLGTDTHLFEMLSRKISKISSKQCLTLCGIKLPHYRKLAADSDGDVALHALTAAISQALSQGSIGTFATALCEKGITDSKKYLTHILIEAKKQHTIITHVGLNFECAIPKIDPLVSQFKKSIAHLLALPENNIGITATTGEKASAWGKGEGIHCMAIVTMNTSL